MPVPRRKGFTLLEVMVAVLIASVLFMAVMAGLVYNMRAQKLARERSHAQRQAAIVLEKARRLAFPNLKPYSDEPVLVDDNRTPEDKSDDLMGKAQLRLYRYVSGGSPVEIAQATGEDFIIAQAEITWQSAGQDRKVIFTSHLAP